MGYGAHARLAEAWRGLVVGEVWREGVLCSWGEGSVGWRGEKGFVGGGRVAEKIFGKWMACGMLRKEREG